LKVELIAHSPDPEKIVASAAKLCYSSVGVTDIMSGLSDEEASKFLGILMDLGHESPIEHVSFTFAIEGVSRVLTHQLVRHRIASYSQQSQRYVKLDQFEYITPPEIAKNPKALEIYNEMMKKSQNAYEELSSILEKDIYAKLISEGMSEKKAKNQATKSAIEDARFVFPNACETKIIVTMNARSLVNFFEHRCCERAQWEIRAVSIEMLKQVRAICPTIFNKVGPRCLKGPCPEGAMTCGKMKDIKEKFEAM
jgi:thymidylate synthase (FAD)